MKKTFDYLIITIITLLFLLITYVSFFVDYKDIYVSFKSNNKEIIINSYYSNDENVLYFFIPSHCFVDSDEASIVLNDNNSISLNGDTLFNKLEVKEVELNKEYKADFFKKKFAKSVVFLKGSDIPSLHIEIPGTSINYLEQDKSFSASGTMLLENADGSIEYFDDFDSFSGRGNSTWSSMPKKGWSLKLNSKESLLGMNKSKNWVLFANAYDDTSGLRNYAAYKLAYSIGLDNTSNMKFVDLYVNGDYLGLYQLCEKIEESKLSLGDLDKLNNEANKSTLKIDKINQTIIDNGETPIYSYSNINSPSEISGGYILERNYGYKLYDKPHYFTTERNESFVIRYPEVASKDEVLYISNIFQNIENALFSNNYVDKNTNKKLEELIDLDSWVRKYLVDEITKNEGAGSTSSYFYKSKDDDKIYGGPVWDYDKSFGNYDVWRDYNQLAYSKLHSNTTYWYERLYGNIDANLLIKKHYKSIRPYLIELSNSMLDNWAKEIEDSYLMNYHRWDYMIKEYNENHPKYVYKDNLYDAKEYMKNWINKRVDFLDKTWIDGK